MTSISSATSGTAATTTQTPEQTAKKLGNALWTKEQALQKVTSDPNAKEGDVAAAQLNVKKASQALEAFMQVMSEMYTMMQRIIQNLKTTS